MQSNLMTITETAEYLRVPTSKVYELVRVKSFPAVKLGKSWRIMKDRLDIWLEEQLENKVSYL
jgi:excisionase family DNA binding protein